MRIGIEHIRCSNPLACIHAHVQRGVDSVGKPTIDLVKLHRGNTEIEKRTCDALLSGAGKNVLRATSTSGCRNLTTEHLGERIETHTEGYKAITEARETFFCPSQCIVIAIESNNAELRELLQQIFRVPTGTKSAVDNYCVVTQRLDARAQQISYSMKQNGDMTKLAGLAIIRRCRSVHFPLLTGYVCTGQTIYRVYSRFA